MGAQEGCCWGLGRALGLGSSFWGQSLAVSLIPSRDLGQASWSFVCWVRKPSLWCFTARLSEMPLLQGAVSVHRLCEARVPAWWISPSDHTGPAHVLGPWPGSQGSKQTSCLDAAGLSAIIASCEWDGLSTFCFLWAASCDPLSCLLRVKVIAESQQPAVFRQPYEVASLVRCSTVTVLLFWCPQTLWQCGLRVGKLSPLLGEAHLAG